MLPFRSEKSNFSPFKKAADPRVDCRSLFPAGHLTPALSPTEGGLSRRDTFLESARGSTRDIMLHGAPLPLAWVLVSDNVIPEYAVPFSEAYGGPQFIARTFLEGQYCIGKAGTGLPLGALITYAGRQLTVKRYEVLCFATEMQWNITQERQGYQQSSFIASNAAKFSRNSLCTSRTEITASMLMESDIMRVIPDERMESSRDYLTHKRQCSSPLSPISRHVIEEICASAALETQTTGMTIRLPPSPSLSVLSIRHEGVESTPQALPTHSCSRTCGCDLESCQTSNLQPKRSSKLFTEMGQAFQKIRGLSSTTQSHSEQNPTTPEQSQALSRTRSLSGVLSARLANSRRAETTLERRNDQGPGRAVPMATNTRVLSPITHFSLPQPFDDSAGSVSAVRSPQKQVRSIEHVISQNYQEEVPSAHMVHTKPSGVVRMSSPLAGRRQLPVFSEPGVSHRRSSLCDTDNGSSPGDTEAESFYRNANHPPRRLDSTNSALVGASTHERKPHVRPMQHLSTHPSVSLRSIGKSLVDLKESHDPEAAPVTLHVDRNRPHAQDRGTAVKPELRSLVASYPLAELPVRAPYSKSNKSAQPRPSAPVTVPLIIVSPSANTRELPESPPCRLKSLDVSIDTRRNRFGSDASLSGERETSAKTRTISSSHEAAAVVAAVTASHTDGPPALSPSVLISDIHEDDTMATRSLGYARPPTASTVEQTSKGQYPSDATPIGGAPVVAEDSRVPEAQSHVRFSSPAGWQLPGPKLPTMQYVAERNDVGESRGYVSVQDTLVREVEKMVVPSLHSDMILAQPSKGTFDDAGIDYTPLSSYSGGRFVNQYDDVQATDVTKEYPISHSQASTRMAMSDSLSLDGHPCVAREKPRLERNPVPHSMLAQVEDTRSSAEASCKVLAEIHPSSEVVSVYSPPGLRRPNRIKDTEYPAGKVEDEGHQDVGRSWGERMHVTASGAGQKYQVPLDEYLRPDEVSPVISKERRDDYFSWDETRIQHREADQGPSSVMRETEGGVQVAGSFTDNDKVSSRQSSSEHGDVVSAVLATAGVAAVVFEAVAEARHKNHSERAEAKVTGDYDSPVGMEYHRVHEDDVALSRTVQQAIVDDSWVSPKAATTRLEVAVAPESQSETHCSSSVDVETDEGCANNANSHSAGDISAGVYTKESSESAIMAKKMVSAEQTPSAKGRTIENTTPDQKKQAQVQASERLQLARNDIEQAEYDAQLVAPHKQKVETLVENGANQYVALDVTGVVTRTSDQSVECPTTIEGQVILEYKMTSLEHENEQVSAEPHSNSASQEPSTIVMSPQVHVNMQQTTAGTATNSNTTHLAGPTLEDRRGQLVDTVTVRPGMDTCARDTRSGNAPRSMSSSRKDVGSSSLVKPSGYEPRISFEKVVAAPLNPISKPVVGDTKPFIQEMTVVPGQGVPIPVASREQPNIADDGARLSIPDEVTEVMITVTCVTSSEEDTIHQTDRVEHGTSQPQPSSGTLRNASPGATLSPPLSLEKNQAILSSKSSETSTETRPSERSTRNTGIEKQPDRIAGVRRLGAMSIRDATGIQRSIPLVRPGYPPRATAPRKSASFDLSKGRPMPERTRSATVYDAAGIAINRADLSRPSVTKKAPLETNEHANDLQRNAGPLVSEAQTTSKQGSVVHPDTRAEVTEGSITGMLSVQKSNEQAEYVDSKLDLRDINDVEEHSLKISSGCTKDSSGGDSTYAVDETSDSLTRSEKTCRRDKTLQQDKAVQEMAKAEVSILPNTLKEQREVFVESSKLSVDVKNASSLSPVHTNASTILEPEHDQHFISASPEEEKSLPKGAGFLKSAEYSASFVRTSNGTASASYDPDPGSYREYLDASVEDEHTIDTDLSSTHFVSAIDGKRPATDSNSHAILYQSTRAQSLDPVTVEGTKENQDISELQVQRSSVLESSSVTIEHREEDLTQFDALPGDSNSTTEISLTTVVVPAAAVVDHPHDDSSTLIITASQTEASEKTVFTEDISRVAAAPPSPLPPTYLAPPSDKQTNIARTMDAVVAIAVASELSREFVQEDTSSTKAMQQANQSESGESTTGKRYDIEDRATYSKRETVPVAMDYSDQCVLTVKKDDAPTTLTSFPPQGSTEHRQTVSDNDTQSASMLSKETALVSSQTSSNAEQTQPTEESSTTMSAAANGDTRMLHSDIGIHSRGNVRGSSVSDSDSISSHIEGGHSRHSSILSWRHQSTDRGESPSDLQRSPDVPSPAQSPHVPHSTISDLPTSSRGETLGVASHSAALVDETHGIVANRYIEHELTLSTHTDSSLKVTTSDHVDIDSDLQVTRESSTLSASPVALITGEEGYICDRADQVVEKYSGTHFVEVASSGLAQEEQTQVVGMQTISGMNKDDEWPSEPPPSYQDATSNYDTSHIQSNDALPEDDHSLRPYAQHSEETKLNIVDTSVDGVQHHFEEGSSVSERHGAFRVTYRVNDRDTEKSTLPESVYAEDILGIRQEILTEGVRSPSKIDRECVLDEYVGAGPNECGSSTLESPTARRRLEVDTLLSSPSVSSSEDRTTSATDAFDVYDESRCQGSLDHMSTQNEGCTTVFSAVSVQNRSSLSTVDEEEDAIHRHTEFPSTEVTLQTDEEVWDDVSHILPQDNDNHLDGLASDVTKSCGGSAVEDEHVESEDAQCASRVDEYQINPLSSGFAARIPGHNEFDNETISLGERTVELQGTPQQSFTSELRIQTENIASLFDEPFSAPFGEVHVETAPSFTDADGAQVSFDYTAGYLATDAIDQHTEFVKEGEEEEEDGSIDMSQEISSQHEEHGSLAPGSDYYPSESGERAMIDEQQRIRESPSRGSPDINIGTFIDERNRVSEADLQEHTVQVAVAVTTEEHDGTDIETDRVCPDLTQTTIRHEYKDVAGAIDLSVSTDKTSSSVSQISRDLDVSDFATETQTSGRYTYMNVSSNLDSQRQDLAEHVNLTENKREQKETAQTTSCERTGGMLDGSEFETRSSSTHPAPDVGNAGKPNEIGLRNNGEQAEAETAGDVTDSESTQNTVPEKALAAAAWVWVASNVTESKSRTPSLEGNKVSVSVEDQPSFLSLPRESSNPSPSSPQTVENTHSTSEFHLSAETAETALAHEDAKVTLVGDEERGQSSISSQPSLDVEICNDSSVGKEEGIDENDSMSEEDSTVLTQASASKSTDELDRHSTQPLVLFEASDKNGSHSSRRQMSHTCLDVVAGSLSADGSLIVPEVDEPQVSIGDSSIANLQSASAKDKSLAPPLSVTPAIQITTPGSGTQQLAYEEEHRENRTVTQIVSRPSSGVSRTILSNSTTEDTLRVEETFGTTNIIDASSKDWTSVVPRDVSSQKTMDSELWMDETWMTHPSRPAIRPMLHRTPSFDYLEEFKEEWIGVDLYDIAEQGVMHRSLSRPLPPLMQSARYEYEEIIQSSDAQALVVSSQSALSGRRDRELDIETRESVLGLSKTTCASRHASIVRGWEELGFVRYVSISGGMGHGPSDDDIHPGAIIRTTEHSTQTPIVIVAARANGQLFDEDKLAEHVLSCINLDLLDAPQELGFLCLVGQKSCEVMGALADTMYAVQDVLLYEGIEIGSASVEEVEMGYWVKVVLWRAQWIEGGARIVETDLDAPGSVVVRHRRVPSDGRDRERDGAIQGTVLALSETTSMPRRDFIVWGWGELGFARYVSPQVRHGLLDDDLQPGAIIRTRDHMQGPTIIVVARPNGQLFDEAKLAEHVLSRINSDLLDTPQELSMLCLVGQKTCEVMGALAETLYAIQDVLLYEGIEIGSASVEEVEMGYWVKVVLWHAQWIEEGEAHIDEGEDEGTLSEVDSPELEE